MGHLKYNSKQPLNIPIPLRGLCALEIPISRHACSYHDLFTLNCTTSTINRQRYLKPIGWSPAHVPIGQKTDSPRVTDFEVKLSLPNLGSLCSFFFSLNFIQVKHPVTQTVGQKSPNTGTVQINYPCHLRTQS